MAETPKRPIAASDDCLKRDKKHRLLKAQGTGGSQFDCPTEVSTPIDNIYRYGIYYLWYTPYGHFYFHCIVVSADSISSPFFRGHRFFLFGGFESTSSVKVSYYATSLMSIIILSNTQLRAHLLNKI